MKQRSRTLPRALPDANAYLLWSDPYRLDGSNDSREHASAVAPSRWRSPWSIITVADINARRYYHLVIRSFKCSETEKIYQRAHSRKLPQSIQRVAMRKLWVLDAAMDLNELRIPPSNRLEALRGDRKAQHSIRINQQWRICFRWRTGDAYDVEIVDYH